MRVWKVKVGFRTIKVVATTRDKARYEAYLELNSGRKKPIPFIDFLHKLKSTKLV